MATRPLARFSLPFGLATAALVFGAPVEAQTPRPIPPDVRGFAAQQIRQANAAARSAARAAAASRATPTASRTPAAPVTVQLSMNVPTGLAPADVAIRGPDGEVRTFAVEGGRSALANRVIVVRPGESVTIQLTPGKARPTP